MEDGDVESRSWTRKFMKSFEKNEIGLSEKSCNYIPNKNARSFITSLLQLNSKRLQTPIGHKAHKNHSFTLMPQIATENSWIITKQFAWYFIQQKLHFKEYANTIYPTIILNNMGKWAVYCSGHSKNYHLYF